MRINLKRFFKWRYIATYSFVVVILSFQNCADPLQIEEENFASKADVYPFAFESKIDTFSYMSCSGFENSVFNNRAVYSFKAAADGPGTGIGLNKAFIDSIGNMRMSQQEQIIQQGSANRGAQLQSAFRRRGNLLQYYVADTSGEGSEGIDFDNILAPLGTEELIQPLLYNKGAKISYFNNLEGLGNRRVETYLYYNGSEALASDLRSRLDFGELIFTLSYVDAKGDYPVIPLSPGEPEEQAYGLGLRMTFAKGHGLSAIGQLLSYPGKSEARVLQTLKEVDLLKPENDKTQMEADWVCPQHLSFMIVKPEDNASVLCGVTNVGQLSYGLSEDPNPTSLGALGVSPEDYNAVRAMLPVEYWHVDFAKRCVVTKETEDKCYDVSLTKPINYAPGVVGPATCGAEEGESQQCPHYVSVCYRRN